MTMKCKFHLQIIFTFEVQTINLQTTHVLSTGTLFQIHSSWFYKRITTKSDDFQGLSVLSSLRPDKLSNLFFEMHYQMRFSFNLIDIYRGFINLTIKPNDAALYIKNFLAMTKHETLLP